MLIIVCGLPGTGKSFFSEKLADNIGAVRLSSDRVREKLNLKGDYHHQAKEQVYQEIFSQAADMLADGQHVLLDATFSQTNHLETARQLGASFNNPVYIIEMTADEATVLDRVSRSRKYSEADEDVYQKIKKKYQPIPFEHLQLDSSDTSIDALIKQAKTYLQP